MYIFYNWVKFEGYYCVFYDIFLNDCGMCYKLVMGDNYFFNMKLKGMSDFIYVIFRF